MKKTITLLAVVLFTTTIFAQLPSYVPTSGLAAWYSFTGNANDDSGNNNNGTVNGATLTVGKLGIANSAYSFNGTSNTINFANPFLGGVQVSSFTFHVLIKFNSTGNSPNIWGKAFNWGDLNFQIGTNKEIIVFWDNNVTGNKYSNIISQTNTIQNGLWYDIVVVFQNSGGQIYLNGLPITTNLLWYDQGGNTLSTTQIEAQCNFAQNANTSKMGLRITGGVSGNYLDGIIDEFGIWNRALTQPEITTLYNTCSASTITSQPTNQNLVVGNNAMFFITASDSSATYQWQTDIGLGFQNLSNAGQYSGVHNDSLNVSTLTMTNNNQLFRCIVSVGSCVDTTNVGVLSVSTSINEFNNNYQLSVFPNPTNTSITINTNVKYSSIKIVNPFGQLVFETGNKKTIDINSLQNGIYFIQLIDEKQRIIKIEKFVKQ